MTLGEFADVFAMLAKQLRATDADQADIECYFKALADLEIEFVQMAAERLSQTAEWFPKTSEWRQAARLIEHQRVNLQRSLLQNRAERLCLACDDTGWAVNPRTNRAARCDCQELRRLEVLGRRPMPQLLEAAPDPVEEPKREALMTAVRQAVRGVR